MPGTVRGLALAHKKFGKLPWKDVVMPGVLLAEEGFTDVGGARARTQRAARGRDGQVPGSVAAYGKPGGGEWAAGDRLVLKDLGKTLRAIATDGPDAFYKGWIADRIAEDMAANGGLITKEDLAAYQAKERAPLRGTFRGFEIVSMPPPSSGGVALIEMLNMLEAVRPEVEGLRSPPKRCTSRSKRCAAPTSIARGTSAIPTSCRSRSRSCISKDHARDARGDDRSGQGQQQRRARQGHRHAPPPQEPDETTHFSVIDRNGMAVSNTYTLEGGYGSRVVVKGAGFLLNNEMGDFNKKPGETTARRRHRHAGQPDRSGQAHAQLDDADDRDQGRQGRAASPDRPGGRTIINTVFTVVLGVDRVRHERARRRWTRRACTTSGCPTRVDASSERASREELAREAEGDGPHGPATTAAPGGRALDLASMPDGTAWGANDKRSAGRQGVGAAPLDIHRGEAIGSLQMFASRAPSPAPSLPASAGRSDLRH